MSQNPYPFMHVRAEEKGPSTSANPFMGITLEDFDVEQAQDVSPDYDRIEAVASGDFSATGYEPDPQVIAEFQGTLSSDAAVDTAHPAFTDAGREAEIGRQPQPFMPDIPVVRAPDAAFASYAPENMGQPSADAGALASFLAGNFRSNMETSLGDAGYVSQYGEAENRKRRIEAGERLVRDIDLSARTIADIYTDPLPAVELSNKTGIPVGAILENHKEISRAYEAAQAGPTRRAALEKMIRDEPITGRWLVRQGAAMVAGLGDRLPEIGTFESLSQEMQDATRVGKLQIEQTDLLNKVFWQDNPAPEDLRRIDQINWELSINQAHRKDEGFLTGAFRSTFSTFLPQVFEGGYRSLVGGAQAGAAAGIATAAFGPMSGVSAGSAFTAGAGAAGIRYAYEMSLGEIYGSLSQLKDENGQPIPRDTARLFSLIGALPSGALEVVGIHKALSLIPGADRLLNRATVASAQQFLNRNPSILQAVGKGAGEALGALAAEVGVETAQEGINIITEEAAKQISGQPFRLTTGEEAVDRLAETAYEALKAFILPIGVGGGGMRVRSAVRDSRQAMNGANALQVLSERAANSKLIEESPSSAEQLLVQLKEEGGMGDLYVNPEAMQRVLFQSDEGLQIARRIGVSAEDVADALDLGTPVAVPMEKAVPYLLNTAQGKELLQDSTLDPAVMTPGELREATAGMTQEQLAQVEALNSFLDFVDSSIAQAQNKRESFDRIAAPYVEQMRNAGYSESQARHYGDLLAANAERMAPMYGMEPAAWLESRLQGIRLVDPGAPSRDVLDARAQRAFARQPLAERDPLLALVRGRLDGKSLSSAYNADTLKEITRANGRGLFKSREKGGLSIDELADEAVRRGLLPEGSGADELVERLKRAGKPERMGQEMRGKALFQPFNEGVNLDRIVPTTIIQRKYPASTLKEKRKAVIAGERERVVKAFKEGVRNENTGWLVAMSKSDFDEHLKFDMESVSLAEQYEAVAALPELTRKAVLVESHADSHGRSEVKQIHRFYAPLTIGEDTYSVLLTMKEFQDGILGFDAVSPIKLYHHRLARKMLPVTRGITALSQGPDSQTGSMSGYTLRDILNAVNDNDGNPYYQTTNHGTPYTFTLDQRMGQGPQNSLYQAEDAEAKLRGESEAWGRTVDGIVAGGRKPSDSQRVLTQTPLVMHMLGAGFRELHLAPHAFDGIFPSQKKNGKHNAHPNITPDILKQLPGAMADPIMVFDSDKGNGRLVFMLEVKDAKGATVVVPVELEGRGIQKKQINLLTSVYAKETAGVPNNGWFASQAQKNLRYVNEGKVKRWSRTARVQFPFVRLSNASGKTILTEADLGKLKDQHPGYYQSPSMVQDAEAKLREEAEAWGKTVDGITGKPRNPQLMLTQTPLAFHLLGADFREVYAAPHIFDGMFPGNTRKGQHAHANIDAGILKQLPAALADPIAVFQSETVSGRLVFMLDVKDASGATVVVPVQLDAKKHSGRALIHIATTAYGKENNGVPNNSWFAKQAGNLLYVNRKKEAQWVSAAGSNSLWSNSTALSGKTILTEADLDKLKSAYPGYYQNENNIRGKIQSVDGKWLISVFRGKKNLSTVIHETGHFFLENLRDAAALETAPEWVENDWAAIKDELGIKDDGFIAREAHEKFARQFEAYAREGKAPRQELQSAFNQFRAWLTSIYRSVRRLLGDEELSADVRAVFDRLLASEEDIALARENGSPAPVIGRASEALGIPAERLDAYRQAVARGMRKGEKEIALRRMHEQKQVENDARTEARDFVRDAPFYRGLRELSAVGGINWDSLTDMAAEELAWQLREKWNAGRERDIIKERGGVPVDDAAAYFGLRDGTEVLAALMNEPTAAEYTDTHIRSKVAEWEKTYVPDAEFMNDTMDEALRIEIESLGGNAGPTTRQLRNVVDRRVGVKKGSTVDAEYKALTAAVRKQRAVIEEAVREVRREERTAARERAKAEREGQRWSDAAKNARIDELRSRLAQLKEEERLKRAALGAAYRARIERNQKVRQIQRIARSKSIPDDFRQQILSLAAHFPGLGTERMVPSPDENRPTLLQFQEALGVEYSLDSACGASPIASWLFEEAQRTGSRRASDLSLSELRDVYDAIKILAHQGRAQDALIGMLHRQELSQAVAETVAPMRSLSETKHITADERNRLPGALRSWFRDSLANMKVMRYLFDAADGYRADHDGPNSRLIVQPLQRAAAQEQALFREYGNALRGLLDPIMGRDMHKTFTIEGVRMPPDVEREFGGQWTLERVLSVALNMGNDGNLAALQRGYNWNPQDLELITRRMTSAEWRFVQSVWDLLDKLYPVINAAYEKMYGIPLKRVEAKPFTVVSADGEVIDMLGGYYPLKFDKQFSDAARRIDDFDALNSQEAILRTPNPKSGMTQERRGAGLPPLLSLSVMTSHVADAIHYGTHTLPLLDAYRIVKQPEYRRSMQRAFGDEAYAQVVPWLRSIARPDRTKIDGINKMFEFLARRGSLAAMGFSFRTALLQTTSIPQSMAEVGTGAFLRGAYHMIAHPLESWNTIRELSPYMVSRSRNMERDVADRLKPFREGAKVFGSKWEEAAFAMIQAVDAAVAYPTWMAKYNDATGKGVGQSKAVLMADDAVIRAQGSGLTMDTTALMRKPGAARLFTMFMSFAMNWQNRQRYYLAGFRESLRTGQSEIGTARFLSHFALEWLAPPMLTLLLIGMGRDGQPPEPEDIGSELLGYWLMGIPVVREIPALFEYNKKFGDSAAFKGLNAAISATRGGMRIAAGEASDEQFYRTMKNALDAVGFVAGVPTAPLWRTVEGTEAFLQGKAGPLAPILGAPAKDKQKRALTF